MDDKQKLAALTNQRIEIKLGEQMFSARKINLNDVEQFMEAVDSAGGFGRSIAILKGFKLVLSRVLRPNLELTPDEVGDIYPGGSLTEMQEILEKLGFPSPQNKEKSGPTGAPSTP